MQPIDEAILVNDPSRPDLPTLTRSQVWHGLVMKAEDATQFVPVITHCKVLERFDGGLVREINMGDRMMRERVTFFPEERVRFEQMDGPLQGGWVDNILDQDANGALRLRFVFSGPIAGPPGGPPGGGPGGPPGGGPPGGGPPGGPPGDIKPIYRVALENTLTAVRRLVQEGKLR